MITRKARGKLGNDDIDKEFDNIIQQVESKFVPVGENQYSIKGYTTKRDLDSNSTITDIKNVLCTLISDLKQIKAVK